MNYSFSGKIEFEDYRQFNKDYLVSLLKRPKIRVSLAVIFVCILFISIVDIGDISAGNKTIFDETLFYIIIGIPVFIGLFLFTFSRNLKKNYSSNAFYNDIQNITIDENAVEYHSENNTTKITRDKVYDLMFCKNGIYIFISKNQAFIIPYHFVNDNEKMMEITNYLKSEYSQLNKNKKGNR
jgi:hypothetical protein